MFDNFLKFFNEQIEYGECATSYQTFISYLGGKQFANGTFNSFSRENVEEWTKIVGNAFPEFANQFSLFGYDWLGRCFGIDLRDSKNEKVLMFEIGTNDVLEIPTTFGEFLNEEIPLYSDACLATKFYEEWLKKNKGIKYGRCVGYKIPLFLGGEDNIENLEDSDMDVYWHIISEIKKNSN